MELGYIPPIFTKANKPHLHWQQLLGPTITEELIKEAHSMTAFTTVIGGQWNTISSIECACGCGVLLSKKTAERGWKVIRGHKAAMGGVVHNKALTGHIRAPRAVTHSIVNNDAINQFFSAQLTLIRQQLEEQHAIKNNAESLIGQLVAQRDKLVKVQQAVKEL